MGISRSYSYNGYDIWDIQIQPAIELINTWGCFLGILHNCFMTHIYICIYIYIYYEWLLRVHPTHNWGIVNIHLGTGMQIQIYPGEIQHGQ